MHRIRLPLALLMIASVSLVAVAAVAEECGAPEQAPLRFRPPVFVDQHRSGGEPVSIVADDGSIIMGAHLGTTLFNPKTVPEADWLTQYANQTYVWRSTDDGATWSRIELAPGVAAHSAMSTGLSDPDFAKDAAGNLYGTEINLANVSVFASHDNGQTWPDANPLANSGDRPWLAGRGPNEVYLRITGSLRKSTDGGATWTELTDPNAYGKIYVDPTDPQGLYAGSRGGVGVEVSRDDGLTWTSHRLEEAANNSVMKSIGVDAEGWVYYGYLQGDAVKFASFDPGATTWSDPVTIPRVGAEDATPFWAWTVAGDAGRAAIGWYEAEPIGDGSYKVRVYVAVTENARGSIVECENGSTIPVAPQFSVADAARRPVHVGGFPCSGTGCNATGDRRLGDFFTINFDRLGRVFVATGDTTRTNVRDTEYMVSRPLFIGAEDDSPRLLATP